MGTKVSVPLKLWISFKNLIEVFSMKNISMNFLSESSIGYVQ